MTSSRGKSRCGPSTTSVPGAMSIRNLITADGDARPAFVAEMSSSGFVVADGEPLIGPRAHARRRTTCGAGGCGDWSRAVEDAIRRRSERARTHGATWRRSPDDRGRDARGLRVPGVARDVGAAEDRPSGPGAAFGSCHHGVRHAGGRPDARDGASGVDDAWAAACGGTEVHARAPRTARGGIREHDGDEWL